MTVSTQRYCKISGDTSAFKVKFDCLALKAGREEEDGCYLWSINRDSLVVMTILL